MKIVNFKNICCLSLLTLISVTWPISAQAGGCAVSDGSVLPSDDGCMLAFMYNQKGDHRLVVIDGKNRRQYEAPLDTSRMAPFWEGGKVYVVAHSGSLQGFSIVADKLVPEPAGSISTNVVRTAEYSRSQHRLYLICVSWDAQRRILYDLSAIDFPAKKMLWTKKIDEPGLLTILDGHVSVAGQTLVEVFNSDTGEKIGTIVTAKSAASTDAERQQ